MKLNNPNYLNGLEASASEIDGNINRGKQTLVILGDSITSRNSNDNFFKDISHTGPVVWANAIAGQPFELIFNAGVNGQNSTQILARVQADVIDKNPSHCMFLMGMNDNPTNDTTLKANIIATYTALNTNGIFSYICTNTTTKTDLEKNKRALRINNWIKSYFKNLPNCEIIDLCSAWIDPLSESGLIRDDVSSDGVHPTNNGGLLGGIVIAEHFKKLRITSQLPSSSLDDYSINSSALNLTKNPLLVGEAGTLQGTSTGKVANNIIGYTSGGATVFSKEIRSDGTGENQVLSITGSLSTQSRIQCSTTSRPLAGERFFAICEIEIVSAVNLRKFGMMLYRDNTVASSVLTAGVTPEFELQIPSGGLKVILKTQILTATTNTLSNFFIQIPFYSMETGTTNIEAKIGRVGIIKVN